MLTASHDDDECSVSKLCTFCRFFSSLSVAVSTIDRAAMRIEFQEKKLCESPQNPHTHRTTKSSIPIPHTLCLFVRYIFK